jgi:hypothetical protein
MSFNKWSHEFKEMKLEADFVSRKAEALFLRSEKAFASADFESKNDLEQNRILEARRSIGAVHQNIARHLAKALDLDRQDYPLHKRKENIRLAGKGLDAIEHAVIEFEALLKQEPLLFLRFSKAG